MASERDTEQMDDSEVIQADHLAATTAKTEIDHNKWMFAKFCCLLTRREV